MKLKLMGEPARTLPFKPPPSGAPYPRWKVGIDRRRVAAYVGVAILGGFGMGFATAQFMASREALKAKDSIPGGEIRRTGQEQPNPAVGLDLVDPAQYNKVIRIIRADTIEVEGLGTIKMIGVQTPDGKSPGGLYSAHGQRALEFTQTSLLTKDVRVEVEASPRRNVAGAAELPGYVYARSGVLFNIELLKQGHAFLDAAQPFRLIDQFRAAEREAMQELRGVWGLSASSASPASSGAPSESERAGSEKSVADPRLKKLNPLLPSEIETRSQPASGADSIVVVSQADRMYHKDQCEYLAKKKQFLTLSQARGEGYAACGRCFASTVLRAP